MGLKLETLEELIKNTDNNHPCKYYKEYDIEVQQMIENVYKATYRVGLFKSQIVYILDKALEPFERRSYEKFSYFKR